MYAESLAFYCTGLQRKMPINHAARTIGVLRKFILNWLVSMNSMNAADDCYVNSDTWLSELGKAFMESSNHQVLLG